jgi:Glu-tRNA(Gln) amidotransferase subunit E-like FAD-binding protein
MRKTVINGSNTSGFQRTLMLARDGYVDTANGRVRVEAIYLEEDAARPVEKQEGFTVYRLDRLGIPLIEISTDASMKNPEQVKEVALYIGNVLRSCKVKRGIGTIRQDLNMSIKNGERVEIKGFQDPRMMVKTLNNEIKRQVELLKAGGEVKKEVRNALPDGSTEFLRPMPGSARMYPETDLPILHVHLDLINEAKKSLPKLRTETKEELEKEGLNEDMIKLLFKLDKVEEFKELTNIVKNPQLVAKVLLIFPREIAGKKKIYFEEVLEKIEDHIPEVLRLVNTGKISQSDIKDVLFNLTEGKTLEEAVKIEKAEVGDVEEKIRKIIKSKPGLSENAYMGLVMQEFKGKISGKDAIDAIRKVMK